MSTYNGLINKISDYLQDRVKQTNFGTCKRCDKKVYWSTTKVASHIRSGHCSGATEEEVSRFKKEFVYDSPKNLVHKSVVKDRNESPLKRKLVKSPEKEVIVKKQHEDSSVVQEHFTSSGTYDDEDHIMYEVEGSDDVQDEKLEIVYVQEDYREPKRDKESSEPPVNKDDKFIAAVYPQFKGKTKLQLIDEIFDLKRQNDLLKDKVKSYEKTIHSLL